MISPRPATASPAMLDVMNGATVNISISDADAESGTVLAAGKRLRLDKAPNGMWKAAFTYYDAANPPPLHPHLDITFVLKNGGRRTTRIPLREHHA